MDREGSRPRIVVALTCALLALALGASAAHAEAPEYGRCVKKEGKPAGAGFVKKPNCVFASESKAKFEWVPGPGPANRFTLTERFGYSHNFHYCVTAHEDEALANQREAEAAEATEQVERERLQNEANQYRVTAEQERELAGLDTAGCEKLIAKETAKSPVMLKTVGHAPLTCGGLSGSGEYSGTKSMSGVTITFTECTMNAVSCQSAGAGPGEVMTSTLEGQLGVIEKAEAPTKSRIGVDWYPAAGEVWAEFSCGEEPVVVTGSIVHPVPIDKMITAAVESAHVVNAHQFPLGFEGLPSDVLSSAFGGGGAEESALILKTFVKNEEAIEVNAVV